MGWPSISMPSINPISTAMTAYNVASEFIHLPKINMPNLPGMDNPWVAMAMGMSPLTRNMYNNYVVSKNMQRQREQQEYERALQERMFAREDSSMARRIADLKSVGLSPVLAAGGSGASAGPVVASTAPQQGKIDDTSLGVMEMMKMSQDISRSKMEQAYLAQQTAKSAIEGMKTLDDMDVNAVTKNKIKSDTRYKDTETREKLYNLLLAMKYGQSTNPGEIGRNYRDLAQAIINSISKHGEIYNKLKPNINRAGKVIEQNVPKNDDYIREFKKLMPFWAQ